MSHVVAVDPAALRVVRCADSRLGALCTLAEDLVGPPSEHLPDEVSLDRENSNAGRSDPRSTRIAAVTEHFSGPLWRKHPERREASS
jgi:hypothetical protein